MAKAPVVEEASIRHAVKVASITGQAKLRDVALLWVAYGTGMMPIELAKLAVGDYLAADGSVREDSEIRAEIAFNDLARPLYWTNKGVASALDAYLAERVRNGYGAGEEGQYRGLDPESPVFLTVDGKPFTFTRRVTPAGSVSFSCESMTQIIRRLHNQAGIEAGSALSARRTFAVRLHRKGFDLRHIQVLLGVQSLVAVKRMVEADPVRLGSIVSRVV
ncbi:MAG: site-specific integrase [Rhodocyclales bacterium]|nr:site-specific integrase [Rhodocyclales bacterium]